MTTIIISNEPEYSTEGPPGVLVLLAEYNALKAQLAALTAERDGLRAERAKVVKDLTQIVKSWRDYASEDYCTITNPEMGNGLKRAANHLERYVNEARRALGAIE